MIRTVPPAAIFLIGSIFVPILKGKSKKAYLLFLPVLSFINMIYISHGKQWFINYMDYNIPFGNVDKLGLVFGYIFHIMAFLTILYAIHLKNDLEYIAGLVYAGAAIGVAFSGNLITFFCFWELMTLGSAFLIWSRKTDKAISAGFRYVLYHFLGSVVLLTGIALHIYQKGSYEFGYIGLNSLSSYLIFIGIGVNCAWPIFHTWLVDSYPETTPVGAVFLSAYTTKTAVYVMSRTFPGTEHLIWIGAAMTIFPIFFAVIENDLRRVLSYILINQIGFMMIGIGIGTELSLNGTAAHAFAHVLYDGLMFMAMGAVLMQTGKIKATDLGGLYKTMPLTCIFCIIGAASFSAFPLFSGFVTKSMVMSASAEEHMHIIWFVLLFASAGVFLISGIKIPFFAFFSRDSGIRTKEPPINILLAMSITAFLCIFIGVYTKPLYDLLPYPVDYVPYTTPHVIAQLQLLFFSGLAFTILILSGTYPAEIRAINLDIDWIYRRGMKPVVLFLDKKVSKYGGYFSICIFKTIPHKLMWVSKNPVAFIKIAEDMLLVQFGSFARKVEIRKRIEQEKAEFPGTLIVPSPIGNTLLFITAFLLAFLLIDFIFN